MPDAAAIFVGIILGSGIFVAPAAVAGAAAGPVSAVLLWATGAAVAACGAFCYAECASRIPRNGGFYVFYREAFGEPVAFVGGWVALFVTYPASMAAIALLLGQYLGEAIPALAGRERAAAAAAIAVAGVLNVVGVKTGPLAQRTLTGAKVAALGGLCCAALVAPTPAWGASAAARAVPGWSALLSAMVVLLWTYDGWSDVSLVSGEIRDPRRNLGRAVLVGTAVLFAVYALVQVSVSTLLPPDQAASSTRVVAEATERSLGPTAGRLVALLVVLSTFGSIHGIVLAVSRLGVAMARDGAFFRWFAAVHPRWETPARSTLALVAASTFYVFSASFRNLLQYFSFTVWIFYGLTAVALLLLRRRRVGEEAVWSAPGGIVPPTVVLATGAAMTGGLLMQNPRGSLYGLAMLATGFVAYAVTRGRTVR